METRQSGWVRGDLLPAELRREVLAAYGHRWTHENAVRACEWSRGRVPHQTPITDKEWLFQHAFRVTRRGRLDARQRWAEPAWLSEPRNDRQRVSSEATS